jgi:hypothetical protein
VHSHGASSPDCCSEFLWKNKELAWYDILIYSEILPEREQLFMDKIVKYLQIGFQGGFFYQKILHT